MRGLVLWVVGCVGVWPSGVGVGAEVAAAVSIQGGEVESFHLAVRDHYHVSDLDFVAVRKAKIQDDDLPVVFHIAERAKCSPSAVVELRAGGKSWMEVSAHFGLGIEVFHVEVEGDCGPPYGRALGHFKHRERHQWAAIRLSDEDVGLLVRLSFLSARHGCSAADVIRMHVGGESIVSFHGRLKTQKRKGNEGGKAPVSPGATLSVSETKGHKGEGGSAPKPPDAKASSRSERGGGASTSKGKGGGGGGSRGRKK